MPPDPSIDFTPAQRNRRRELDDAEVQAFYSGTYQQVHRYFGKQFPTADWRREAVALIAWTTLAKVPTHTRHDQGIWTIDQCWRLSSTAGEFLKHLDDVKAGKIPAPDWAKNLPPRAHPSFTVPHSGSFVQKPAPVEERGNWRSRRESSAIDGLYITGFESAEGEFAAEVLKAAVAQPSQRSALTMSHRDI